MSRFHLKPAKLKFGKPIQVIGLAQFGFGGLSKVQIWVNPKDKNYLKTILFLNHSLTRCENFTFTDSLRRWLS